MKLLDATFATPAENLACDEALLDGCEERGEETLRFWESHVPFVVVGYGNKVENEVNVTACRERNIAVLRRCSGGGTVVQGPGCLNYAVTLRIHEHGPLANVSGTNRFVMEQNRAAIETLVDSRVTIQGYTDLAVEAGRAGDNTARLLKFSGNAQRRRRCAVLFHGTILHAFDLTLIQTLLIMPSKQPEYRNSRAHEEFVTNFPVSADAIRKAFCAAWKVRTTASPPAITSRLLEKYSRGDWHRTP